MYDLFKIFLDIFLKILFSIGQRFMIFQFFLLFFYWFIVMLHEIELFCISFLKLIQDNEKVILEYPSSSVFNESTNSIILSEKLSKLELSMNSVKTAQLFRLLEICYKNILMNTWSTKRFVFLM